VLLSGGGTTLQNLLDLSAAGTLPARVACVVSSKADAFGLERARKAGVPAFVVQRKACASLEEFSERILRHYTEHGVELVCMAGFLQLLRIPEAWRWRVMNVHPALLPAFGGHGYYGQRVHEAALEAGVKVSGCTVHFADIEYDNGPIIVQRSVPVMEGDTAESLQARVMGAEREAYPEAIRLFAEDRLRVEGRRVRILPAGG
jgi:formyltetrahydrofolate-dependent phosphoribosylglycinamide formyltransferase